MPTTFDSAPQGEQSYAPEFATTSTGEHLPRISPAAPWIFAAHPSRWIVLAGELVPYLRKVTLRAGVERVNIDRKTGKVHFADTRAKLEQEGWILVPYSAAPDGNSYLKQVTTRLSNGEQAEATISVFERAVPGAKKTRPDLRGYVAWLKGLVASGLIPPCDPFIAENMADRSRAVLAKLEATTKDSPALQGVVDQLRNEVAVLDAYAELAEGVPGQAITPDLGL